MTHSFRLIVACVIAGTLSAAIPGVPVTTVRVKDEQLELEARAVSGTYRGTLGPSGEIVGEWTQRAVRLPLTFRRPVATVSKK